MWRTGYGEVERLSSTLDIIVSRNPSDETPRRLEWADMGISGGIDPMFASQVTPHLILRPRPDRRANDRFAHSQPVEINGLPAVGRDISSNGIAVITGAPVAVGDVVSVTVSDPLDAPGPRTTSARVARIDRRAERLVVGLEFIH